MDEVDKRVIEREDRLQARVDKHPSGEAEAPPQPLGVRGDMDLPADEPQPAKHHNRFEALAEDEVEKPQLVVQLKDAIRPVSLNKAKKARRVAFCEGIKSCCLDCDKSHMKDLGCENLKEICVNTLQECDGRVPEAATPMLVTAASRMSARMFSKMIVTGSLMPVAQRSELETRLGKFEVLSAIVDSGATVPVMNPTTGARYDVLLGSANGTEYEIASGDTLEDLGEKRMAVLTAEGILRG